MIIILYLGLTRELGTICMLEKTNRPSSDSALTGVSCCGRSGSTETAAAPHQRRRPWRGIILGPQGPALPSPHMLTPLCSVRRATPHWLHHMAPNDGPRLGAPGAPAPLRRPTSTRRQHVPASTDLYHGQPEHLLFLLRPRNSQTIIPVDHRSTQLNHL